MVKNIPSIEIKTDEITADRFTVRSPGKRLLVGNVSAKKFADILASEKTLAVLERPEIYRRIQKGDNVSITVTGDVTGTVDVIIVSKYRGRVKATISADLVLDWN